MLHAELNKDIEDKLVQPAKETMALAEMLITLFRSEADVSEIEAARQRLENATTLQMQKNEAFVSKWGRDKSNE